MLTLKKTAVAVLAFGSSAVFAGTMGPVCTPGNVTVPCESMAWDFGGKALYLKPSYSGRGYIGTSTVGTTETFLETPNDWDWGFMIEGSYHFNTGNDINVNWYHWSNSDSVVGAAAFDTYLADGGAVFTGGGSVAHSAKWDAVNVEFAQHADFGEMANARFHGGVQYARVKENFTITAPVTGFPTFASVGSTTYNGFGPRAGIDMSYDWGNGVGVYAKPAAALLVGNSSFSNSPNIAGTTLEQSTGKTTTIVPELEAKLGLTYTYAMAQGDLMLDVGWMWANYFNALEHGVNEAGGASAESDFGVQGVIFGAKWVGNFA